MSSCWPQPTSRPATWGEEGERESVRGGRCGEAHHLLATCRVPSRPAACRSDMSGDGRLAIPTAAAVHLPRTAPCWRRTHTRHLWDALDAVDGEHDGDRGGRLAVQHVCCGAANRIHVGLAGADAWGRRRWGSGAAGEDGLRRGEGRGKSGAAQRRLGEVRGRGVRCRAAALRVALGLQACTPAQRMQRAGSVAAGWRHERPRLRDTARTVNRGTATCRPSVGPCPFSGATLDQPPPVRCCCACA